MKFKDNSSKNGRQYHKEKLKNCGHALGIHGNKHRTRVLISVGVKT
jgi:hypothetical protein